MCMAAYARYLVLAGIDDSKANVLSNLWEEQ